MSLLELQNLVDDIVRDEGTAIDTAQRDRAIDVANLQYSKDRERFITTDLTVDQNGLLALPAGWEPYFSFIKKAAIAGSPIDVSVIETLAGFSLVADRTLAPDTAVTVLYRIPHVITAETFSPAKTDIEAIAAWAAAALLDQLATKHAADQDSTIQTDAVNYQTTSRAYASRANAQRARYYEILNAQKGKAAAACAIVDMDRNNQRGGDRLFHKRSMR